jgi:hypothetical protein
MAYVLPLPSNNSVEQLFAEQPFIRSCSSFASHASCGTVRRHFPRSVSAASVKSVSIKSISSLPNGYWLASNEDTPPRLASRSLLNLIHELNSHAAPRRASSHIAQKPSWHSSGESSPILAPCSEDIDNSTPGVEGHSQLSVSTCNTRNGPPENDADQEPLQYVGHNICIEQDDVPNPAIGKANWQHAPEQESESFPFTRWLSTLRRRNHQKKNIHRICEEPTLPHMNDGPQFRNSTLERNDIKSGHRKSLSLTSSLGFITAVKSASMTLASASIAPHSRNGAKSGHVRSDHGSSAFSDIRMSVDSRGAVESGMDEKAKHRSMQRQKIIEEIIQSEESYIADMKALVNVCQSTFLQVVSC